MLLCKSVKHELNLRRLFKASWVLFDQNLSEPKKIEITVADILRSSLKCCTVAWLCSQTWHSVMAKPIKKYFTEDTEQVNHTSYRITNKIRVREILQGYVQHLYRELKKQLWMRPFFFPAVISQADSTSLHAPRLKNVIQRKSYVCSAGYLPTVIQCCHVHWRKSDRGKFNYSLTSPTVSTITRLFVNRFTPGSH